MTEEAETKAARMLPEVQDRRKQTEGNRRQRREQRFRAPRRSQHRFVQRLCMTHAKLSRARVAAREWDAGGRSARALCVKDSNWWSRSGEQSELLSAEYANVQSGGFLGECDVRGGGEWCRSLSAASRGATEVAVPLALPHYRPQSDFPPSRTVRSSTVY